MTQYQKFMLLLQTYLITQPYRREQDACLILEAALDLDERDVSRLVKDAVDESLMMAVESFVHRWRSLG